MFAMKKVSLLEYCFSIKNESHLEEILEDYDSMHVAANLEIIQRLVTDRFTFKEQPKELATYSCHRGVEDGEIDWNLDIFYVLTYTSSVKTLSRSSIFI